jgi:hypothetical protein
MWGFLGPTPFATRLRLLLHRQSPHLRDRIVRCR